MLVWIATHTLAFLCGVLFAPVIKVLLAKLLKKTEEDA